MGIGDFVKRGVKAVGKGIKKVVKGVGKVFKRVLKALPAIAKVVVMAVAAYFTFGVALSFMPAAAPMIASAPGFAANGVAGAGIFSQAAANIGLGGGLASGASVATGASVSTAMLGNAAAIEAAAGAANASAAVGSMGSVGAAPGAVEAAGQAATATLDGGVSLGTASETSSVLASNGVTGGAVGGGGAGGGGVAVNAGMSTSDKLLLASTGLQAVGAFMQPSIDEEYEARAKFRGSFYGSEGGGGGTSYAPTAPDGNPYSSSAAATAGVPQAAKAKPMPAPVMMDTGVQPLIKSEVTRYG